MLMLKRRVTICSGWLQGMDSLPQMIIDPILLPFEAPSVLRVFLPGVDCWNHLTTSRGESVGAFEDLELQYQNHDNSFLLQVEVVRKANCLP